MTDVAPKLILLDRDGVINVDSAHFIKHPDEWHAIPNALAAVAKLQAHFEVAVCTNQSGVGRGLFDEATLADIHSKLNRLLVQAGGRPLTIFYCPHHPDDDCNCRKPKPGLLQVALDSFQRQGSECIYVGDTNTDLDAAASAGCAAALVLSGRGAQTLAANPHLAARAHDDLLAFANSLLGDSDR